MYTSGVSTVCSVSYFNNFDAMSQLMCYFVGL